MSAMYLIDISKERYLPLCITTFLVVKHKSTLIGNLHEVVESIVALLEVLSMDAEVMSNSNDTGALFQNLVNFLLKIVLAVDESWRQVSKAVLAKW